MKIGDMCKTKYDYAPLFLDYETAYDASEYSCNEHNFISKTDFIFILEIKKGKFHETYFVKVLTKLGINWMHLVDLKLSHTP